MRNESLSKKDFYGAKRKYIDLYVFTTLMKDLTLKLKRLLEKSVRNNLADGILFSGGLDTGILAYIGSKYKHLKAFTVAVNNKASDIKYSTGLAKRMGLKHHVYYSSMDELLQTMPELINILRTFDPMELRNSIIIYLALKLAKSKGTDSIMTGDGADELFAGYSYLWDKNDDELRAYTEHLVKVMHFSSMELGKRLGIRVKAPYLDPVIIEFALSIGRTLKVNTKNGKTYGKWILRKTFENFLPQEIVWRDKTAIEFGSGATKIGTFVRAKILRKEFNEKKERYEEMDGVKLRNREQLWYYEIYREVVGVPHPTSAGKNCPFCNSTLPAEISRYCRVCGAYPI